MICCCCQLAAVGAASLIKASGGHGVNWAGLQRTEHTVHLMLVATPSTNRLLEFAVVCCNVRRCHVRVWDSYFFSNSIFHQKMIPFFENLDFNSFNSRLTTWAEFPGEMFLFWERGNFQ
jgi:hypothetical protein